MHAFLYNLFIRAAASCFLSSLNSRDSIMSRINIAVLLSSKKSLLWLRHFFSVSSHDGSKHDIQMVAKNYLCHEVLHDNETTSLFLLKAGLNANVFLVGNVISPHLIRRNGTGVPLLLAALSKVPCSFNIMKILIKHSVDINCSDLKTKDAALHLAVHAILIPESSQHDRVQRIELLHLLLQSGANIDSINTEGMTPLMLAIKFAKLQEAHLLLEKNADVRLVEYHRKNTCLHLTMLSIIPSRDIVDDDKIQLIKILCAKGVDANAYNADEESALTLAIKMKKLSVVRCLIIDCKADYNSKNKNEMSGYEALCEFFASSVNSPYTSPNLEAIKDAMSYECSSLLDWIEEKQSMNSKV